MGTIERIQHVDADTGTKILQLTSFPNLHWLMGPTPDAIAPDGSTLLLQANSAPVRNAGRDLWRVNADGSDLEPVLEDAGGGIVTTDGRWIVTSHPRGDGTALVRIPLAGGAVEEIAGSDRHTQIHVSARTGDGRYAVGAGKRPDDTFDVLRLDLADGSLTAVCRATYLMPVQCHGPSATRLLSSITPIDERGEEARPWGRWSFDLDGDDWRFVPIDRSTNHYSGNAANLDVITTASHPAMALDVAAPGDADARVLCHGAGFWHVGVDSTGEWAVADTNWPDIGLQLAHVPSGRFRTVCETGAGGGHPQWTHAHPCLAPDADYALYTSDRTGVQQVYKAEISREMRDVLAEDAG